MTITVHQPPVEQAVDLELTKSQLRLDAPDEDGLTEFHLQSSLQHVENVLGSRLITQTLDISMDGFPGRCFRLPIGPVQSVTQISYLDSSSPVVLDASAYELSKDYIQETNGWPSVDDVFDSVTVRAVVGYGDSPDKVPVAIRLAVVQLAGHFHSHRGVAEQTALNEIPLSFDELLKPYKRHNFA